LSLGSRDAVGLNHEVADRLTALLESQGNNCRYRDHSMAFLERSDSGTRGKWRSEWNRDAQPALPGVGWL